MNHPTALCYLIVIAAYVVGVILTQPREHWPLPINLLAALGMWLLMSVTVMAMYFVVPVIGLFHLVRGPGRRRSS
jgi:hypothetical protein